MRNPVKTSNCQFSVIVSKQCVKTQLLDFCDIISKTDLKGGFDGKHRSPSLQEQCVKYTDTRAHMHIYTHGLLKNQHLLISNYFTFLL